MVLYLIRSKNVLLGTKFSNVRVIQPRFLSIPPPGSRIIASLDAGPNLGSVQPAPEDAKGQARAAFRTYGSIFKAIAFGSIGLGISASIAFFGVHLWVEYLELPPGKRGLRNKEQSYGWDEEIEGWGAGYLGGGTDPRLGWRARSLVRAAWVAEHWQSGQVALDAEDSGNSASSQLVDSAYATAEKNLQQAVFMAKDAGLKLDQNHDPDRGLVELQNRLANICEKINTPLSLMKAFQIYSHVWNSCVASVERKNQSGFEAWEMREALRIGRRLGDVGLKLSALQASEVEESSSFQQREAEQYLTWAITTGLGSVVADGSVFRECHLTRNESTVEGDSRKSFWSWPRKLKSSSREISGPLKAEADLINYTLEALASPKSTLNDKATSPLPAAIRATVSSLVRFSVHLVSVDQALAYEFQGFLLRFLGSITSKSESSDVSPEAALHFSWLKSREALSSAYLAEIGYATNRLDDASVISLCLTSLKKLDSILSYLNTSEEAFRAGRTRQSSGRLSEQAYALRRDARLTAAMASNIIGLRLEDSSNDCKRIFSKESEVPRLSAEEFFQRAVKYSTGSEDGKSEDFTRTLEDSKRHLARIEKKKNG